MYAIYKETHISPKGKIKVVKESKMYYGNHKDYEFLQELAATCGHKLLWLSASGVN